MAFILRNSIQKNHLWLSIDISRSHRPSMLLISDADDDKIEWVIEAVKAFLPQSANNQYLDYSFDYEGRYDEYGHRKMER